jgi:hypothetical protein
MKTEHRCPNEEVLAAWFDGLLPPADAAALQRDLIGCPDCTRLVAALGLVIETDTELAWLAAPPTPAAVARRALDLWPADPDPLIRSMRLAVRWLGDALAPIMGALQPLPAPAMALRGASASGLEELRYQVTIGDVPVEIDLEVDGPDQIALSIRPVSVPPSGLLVRLRADGETCAMSSLTADGTTLPALPIGAYLLSLEQAGQAIGSLELTLTASDA